MGLFQKTWFRLLSFEFRVSTPMRKLVPRNRKLHIPMSPFPALAGLIFLLLLTSEAAGEVSSHLCRVAIRPSTNYTRLIFRLDKETESSIAFPARRRIHLVFNKTDGRLFKKLRNYSDRYIAGIVVSQRGDNLLVTISAMEDGPGVRSVRFSGSHIYSLDVGPLFKATVSQSVIPGRESIWNGAGKLIREFDPPLKSDIPFIPTDRRLLEKLIPPTELKLFLSGEAAIYKGNGTEAEEVFAFFMKKESPVRALAAYRRGEALYLLQKYDAALKAFREGERLWPQYMSSNPSVTFYYADSIVRSGDLPGGRRVLTRLIAELADKKYAPLLLVRLADILARQRREMEALAIYRTVVANFTGNKAVSHAAMKLADRRIFTTGGETYQELVQEYKKINETSSDFSLREEALFKATLLESMYGPGMTALSMVVGYQKKYPRGVFINIAGSMREELLVPVYQELYAAKDFQGLVKLAQENRDYLAGCLADDKFIERLADSFAAARMLKGEITLFGNLIEREWATASVPFMLSRILDDALALSDYSLAEGAARGFLQRFPHHQYAHRIREKLGEICYRKNDMKEVVSELSWLLAPRTRADFPESYYYLGKALAGAGKHKEADKAMTLFIAAIKERGIASPLLTDAYYMSAFSRTAAGDRQGAMAVYRAGLEIAEAGRRDQFLYKMGELSMLDGKTNEARSLWEQIKTGGNDPVWQKLAVQAIDDLEWRERMKGKITTLSN
ncbi:MAG: hypothetical protein FD174_2124 [Geobacteraceae bacterium]|nr:MAG: hypothetical protein FD174_2124 [Geobacteraceae bacterium]